MLPNSVFIVNMRSNENHIKVARASTQIMALAFDIYIDIRNLLAFRFVYVIEADLTSFHPHRIKVQWQSQINICCRSANRHFFIFATVRIDHLLRF